MQKDKVIVYNTNTIRTKLIVQTIEVSLFHNNVYSYEVGTQTSVQIKQGVLISEVSFKRGSAVANVK